MAVKQCLECGGTIEAGERVCPFCGHTRKPLAGIVVAAVLLCGTAGAAWYYLSRTPPSSAAIGPASTVKAGPETSPIVAGKPVLSLPLAPICANQEALKRYTGGKGATAVDEFLEGGCILADEEMPFAVLEVLDSGVVVMQGDYRGQVKRFWAALHSLKPYRAP